MNNEKSLDLINEEQRQIIEQRAGLSYDQIPRVTDDDIEVISRQHLSHIREPMMTVRPDGISFNKSAISKMPETLYILPKISQKGQRIYIVASNEDELNSQKWANLKEEKREPRKITGRGLGRKIFRLMNWNEGYRYLVYGSMALKENEEDPLVLCFELARADRDFLTEKARMTLGISMEDLGDEADAVQAEDERRRIEKEEREKDKAEGKTPRKKKDTREQIKVPGEGEFGPLDKDYIKHITIPHIMDGQMSLSDFVTLTNAPEKEGDLYGNGSG